MRYGRASQIKDGNIIVPLWLIFDARGNVRLTRGEPDLTRHERAMRMTVRVPQALFMTPTISASLTIEAPTMAVPEIDVVAAAEALKSVVGCDVEVRVAAPEDSEPA